MKRFTSTLISLLLIAVVATTAVPLVHAQTPPASAPAAASTQTPGSTPAAGAAPSAGATQQQGPDNSTSLDVSQNHDSGYDLVMSNIMRLFAWLVGMAAITLDNAAYYTVVTMGNYVNGLNAVGVAWRILRDFGNIILIFGFLAVGITTILNVSWYGGGKKMLPLLLVAAVFLNFSLFIAEAFVDVGNLFATEIYIQINDGRTPQALDYSSTNLHDEGISNKIMAQVGLQTVYNMNINNNGDVLKSGNLWIVGWMAVLLFLVAAFVMFSLAFILVFRFVALILLIIIAPIGFAGLAVPKLSQYAHQWWSTLLKEAFVAPILMLMLYVALAVITDAKFLTGFGVASGSDGWASAIIGGMNNGQAGANGVASLAGLLLSFLVAMGLLLAVTILAKRMGSFGAAWVTSTTQNMMTYPGRVAAKHAVGRTGQFAEWARKTKYGRYAVGATRLATLGLVGDYEWKHYSEKMQNAKFGTLGSVKERGEFAKKNATELDAAARKRKARTDIKEAQDEFEKSDKGEDAQALRDERITAAFRQLSDKEIAELKGIKDGISALVDNLSPQQFKSMMEDKDTTEEQKATIRNARFKTRTGKLTNALARMNDDALPQESRDAAREEYKKIVREIPTSDLEYAPPEFMTDATLGALSESTRVDLVKSGRVGPVLTKKLKALDPVEKVKGVFTDADKGLAAARAIRSNNLKPEAVAKLPPDVLKSEEVMKSLSSADLTKLHGEIDENTRADMSRDYQTMANNGTLPAPLKKFFSGVAGDIWGVTVPEGAGGNAPRQQWQPPGGVPPRNRPIR